MVASDTHETEDAMNPRRLCSAICQGCSQVFFLPGANLGGVLLVVTMIRPDIGLAGIIAVLASCVFARVIHLDKTFLDHGFYFYNPLLVGLSIGYLHQLSPIVCALIAMAGVLTLLVCVAVSHVFRSFLSLPVLSLPFVAISSVVYLASLRFGGLPPRNTALPSLFLAEWGLPFWIAGFFKSFGAVLFVPHVAAGVVFAALILMRSRILFLLALLGYYAGAGARMLLLGSAVSAFSEPNNFNFILTAMAIGGVFVVPSLRSYLLAVIGVLTSVLVLDALLTLWSFHTLPPYALPFNLISLGMLYVLSLIAFPGVVTCPGRTPEETLENSIAEQARHRGEYRCLFLPFSGTWTVWQGFNGRWTHQGQWRYAYDFVITGADSKTYRDDGTDLADYYCYRKPVLAPTSGRVVQVVNDLPDCAIGQPDKTNNWGNLIVVEDARGFFVEISHFSQRSIRVSAGDTVSRGDVLGLCGNSGYSPQPHIHIQVQLQNQIGAATVPFSFASYITGASYCANELPDEGTCVCPTWPDKRLETVMSFHLDDIHTYELACDGKTTHRSSIRVAMAPDGTFFFGSDSGKLYFGKHAGTFYFHRLEGKDPILRLLFFATPRLPLTYRNDLTWDDSVPVSVATSGIRRFFRQLGSTFCPELAKVRTSHRFLGRRLIETLVEPTKSGARAKMRVELDSENGIVSVQTGRLELRRVQIDDADDALSDRLTESSGQGVESRLQTRESRSLRYREHPHGHTPPITQHFAST